MKHDILLLLNFFMCSGIAWAAFCRLNAGSKRIRWYERAKYVFLLTATVGSALQGPLFGERPGWADVFLASALFFYLAASLHRWKNGPPEDSLNSVMPGQL